MSWLDDVPVGNDDQNPYDPNQPIEREFVLAPAWRAFKAHVSAVFKRSAAQREEESFPVSEPQPLTSRISEPEPHPVHHRAEPEISIPAVEQQSAMSTDEAEPQPSVAAPHYEPFTNEAPSPEPEPVSAAPFEPEPVLLQETAEDYKFESAPAVHQSIQEPEIEPFRYEDPTPSEEPEPIHSEVRRLNEDTGVAAAASASFVGEAPAMPSAAHATSATVLANARGESKLVAFAVAVESWIGSVNTRFADWKASRNQKRQDAQQELFVVPKRSERDRLWLQTTVAAAAIALAFLMGWIAANSRRPAASAREDATTAPAESPVISTRGVSASPAVARPAGVTVQAGGATVQAGGVTLLPSSNVSAAMPPTTAPDEADPSKPSPAKSVQHNRAASHKHLRRSIDAAPMDDEVVVHHYAPKPSPVASAQKQTAQVKQYSDIN